jgi:arginine utilization protein RocB
MKSGVAVALAAFRAAVEQRPGCGVLFVATPDEEHDSAGVLAALPELRALCPRRRLRLAGVLNLDYATEPVAYVGVMGKLLAGAYVMGRTTHAAAPLDGVDASRLVSELVVRVTRSRELVDRVGDAHGVPPVALRVRDLKARYDVQTAAEAGAEFNLITLGRSVDDTVRLLRHEAIHALRETIRSQLELRSLLKADRFAAHVDGDAAERVLTYAELLERANVAADEDPLDAVAPDPGGPRDARAASLARVRELARRAGLIGPAIVVYLLPPYYPHAAPGTSMFVQAVREALAEERGIAVRPYYPLITDASYLAWRAEPPDALGRHMPAFGREYRLPVDDARALDLDVVNLGPWGHDAHGLTERVYAPYAFERLPQLVWNVITRVSELAPDREPVA